MRARILTAALSLALAGTAAAQTTPTPASAPAAATPGGRTVFTVQPIQLLLTFYNAELEHAIAPTTSIAVDGNYASVDLFDASADIASTDVKLRYYPDGRVFQGFSFGVSAGYTHLGAHAGSSAGTAAGPTTGVLLDYGWLLGAQRNFHVATGIGAKAVFLGANRYTDNVWRYPVARLSVGFRF